MKFKKTWPERTIEISIKREDIRFKASVRDHGGYSGPTETYDISVVADFSDQGVSFQGRSAVRKEVNLLDNPDFDALKNEAYNNLMAEANGWPDDPDLHYY